MKRDLSKVYGSSLNQQIYTAMVIASQNVKSKNPKKKEIALLLDSIASNMIRFRGFEAEFAKVHKLKLDRSTQRVLGERLEGILAEIGEGAMKSKTGNKLVFSESLKQRVFELSKMAEGYARVSEMKLKRLRKPQQIAKRKAKRRPGK